MFNFFKKRDSEVSNEELVFDPELIGCALAYEVAVSDGEIDDNELHKIQSEIMKKAVKNQVRDPITGQFMKQNVQTK